MPFGFQEHASLKEYKLIDLTQQQTKLLEKIKNKLCKINEILIFCNLFTCSKSEKAAIDRRIQELEEKKQNIENEMARIAINRLVSKSRIYNIKYLRN